MKKVLTAILAMALILSMLCTSALAVRGDVTIKPVKAYSDKAGKNCIGTIPAYTSVLVNTVKGGVAQAYVNGRVVYVLASGLLHNSKGSGYMAGLAKGTYIYQRASTSARHVELRSNVKVYIMEIEGGWAMVRSSSKGVFAFVPVSRLIGVTPVK